MKKIAELTPGIYRIRNRNLRYSFRGESATNQAHILRVVGVGDACRYYIDEDTEGQNPRKMNFARSYQVLSRYSQFPDIMRANLMISFSDDDGDRFEFTINDAWRLRTVLEEIPWLKHGFGSISTGKTKPLIHLLK